MATTAAPADERRPEDLIFDPVDPELHEPPRARSVPPHSLKVEEYAPAQTSAMLRLPTHIYFGQGLEVISEVIGDRLISRPLGSQSEWSVSPLTLDGPHAVSFSDETSRFYCVDTENHRVVSFPDPAQGLFTSAESIAGSVLDHPHDVVLDAGSGELYVLNPNQPLLFRLRDLGEDESLLDISALAGYSRGLAVVDGRVYVAASSVGAVIEVLDFDAGEVEIHPSFGKLQTASAGTWDTTGFVINDVEFYDGYWYLSNFFSPHYANGTDYNLFKLVRFRTWEDLANGCWEDLGHLVGDGQVPYFFTVHDGSLFVAAFHGVDIADKVYRITAGLFFDDFESGDAGAWR